MERSVSYGELAMLEYLFGRQMLNLKLDFADEEYRAEALNDFIDQYVNGNDNPEVRLLYPDRLIKL